QYITDRLSGTVILVGHSFGARVALRLAARRLPQIQQLVLMAAPGLPPSGFSRVRVRRLWIRTLRKFLGTVRGLTGPAPLAWHTRTYGSRDYLAAGDLRT